MNCWILPDGSCCESQPTGYIGFIYKTTLLIPFENYPANTIYIGKKVFLHSRTSKLSKKGRKGTRKRSVTKTKDSGWLDYFGSSTEVKRVVKELGPEAFSRHVLHLCCNKSQLSYMELEEQIKHDVFRIPSFNAWIGCKVFKSNFLK